MCRLVCDKIKSMKIDQVVRADLLVDQCHYFVNLAHIDMLEGIALKHVPPQYLK
jgi:hypothetical protein